MEQQPLKRRFKSCFIDSDNPKVAYNCNRIVSNHVREREGGKIENEGIFMTGRVYACFLRNITRENFSRGSILWRWMSTTVNKYSTTLRKLINYKGTDYLSILHSFELLSHQHEQPISSIYNHCNQKEHLQCSVAKVLSQEQQ